MQADVPGRSRMVDLPASLLHTVRTGWVERGAIAHRCAEKMNRDVHWRNESIFEVPQCIANTF